MSNPIVEHIPAESWTEPTQWRLLEDLTVLEYTIPAGFVTDGASIPRLFYPIFTPTGRYFKAAILHDYMLQFNDAEKYREKVGFWSLANLEFCRAMDDLGIRPWRRTLILLAVTLWGRMSSVR